MNRAIVPLLLVTNCCALATLAPAQTGPLPELNPRGSIHVPIGIANTLDTLKTFVEAEGNFSPGFATYGIYFWVYDPASGSLIAPTIGGVKCEHGLTGGGYLIPWSKWEAAGIEVKTEVCEVRRASPAGEVYLAAARVSLANPGRQLRRMALYAVLRPVGAAGGPVRQLSAEGDGSALLVDGHAALVAGVKPSAAGVDAADSAGLLAGKGEVPRRKMAPSDSGDCSGAMRFDLLLAPGTTRTLGFLCPVLPGRRAVGHQWDGTNSWAQLDLAEPNPRQGGVLQPDPGLAYYKSLQADAVFDEATAYWRDLVGRTSVNVPDRRWSECFAAIVGHAALEMNEGAPDVAVVNYNVFNRDGVYVANILQKAGHPELAAEAIDYFLKHPFNGRVQCEADNPGQVLWIMGEHWRFTRDQKWLERVYPSAAKLAAMIRYYRTAPPPHYVKATSLDCGDALPHDRPDEKPANRRQVLRPGSCDGHHPEYTEAFDIAGLRAAAVLARAAGKQEAAAAWERLAGSLLKSYDNRFGGGLARQYGAFSVLWPCRLYPLDGEQARTHFAAIGARRPEGCRYFPLATAHQGLLAGNRAAGHGTIAAHLAHAQMQGWYVFDEGGGSGTGGWRFARTTWKPGTAMPHGWAIAEMFLLLRDSLLLEEGDRLILLGGISPEWFRHKAGIEVRNLPTWFGSFSMTWKPDDHRAVVALTGSADPPSGYVLRLPAGLAGEVAADGTVIEPAADGDCRLPAGTKSAVIKFR